MLEPIVSSAQKNDAIFKSNQKRLKDNILTSLA